MENIKYNNESVRRQDRLLKEDDAIMLLRNGEYGVLSMVETFDGVLGGYGIPANYVWDSKKSIYFHCASEGHKLDCLQENPNVSFCVVGRTNVIPNKFTTEYESIIIRGVMQADLPTEERMDALMLILSKYSPEEEEVGKKYVKISFHRTNILRLDIIEISGKTKRMVK